MCEFHDSNGNGFGDIWWTDKLNYFSSIEGIYIQMVEKLRKAIYLIVVKSVCRYEYCHLLRI